MRLLFHPGARAFLLFHIKNSIQRIFTIFNCFREKSLSKVILRFKTVAGPLSQRLQKTLFLLRHIQSQCAARIHDIVRVKVLFERADDSIFIPPHCPFQPRTEHFADAVVVAHSRAALLNGVQNSRMVGLKFLQAAHLCQKNKIQVRSLGVNMGHMRHADRVGARMAIGAHIRMYAAHIAPVDAAFHGLDDKAEILQRVPQVWVAETAVLPAFRHKARQAHTAEFAAHSRYVPRAVFGKPLLSVGEAQIQALLLRLKANFLWPAMWSAAFYADDPMNSPLADEMGIIIGTSHHEPMARNHQEYARNRKLYGEWNYQRNKEGVERFFREGIKRMNGKEEVITIAMRGDGDAPMGPDTDTHLLEDIVKGQRKIIADVTGKPACKTPQLWALYSEVLEYYDKGMKIPDDVMILLCDDNWGNVRRLPDLKDKRHPGGYGMYYHVDLHGAPRAYQWLNMTQIQHMWEQLYLTYSYGVDKMWILNVGDLKPNEFPVDFFLNMAWNPGHLTADNLQEYTCSFCKQQFGDNYAVEAARILNLYCKYAARVTAEMLDSQTYNLSSGEFKAVTDEFLALEAHAYRQFMTLPEELKDTYKELILFPVQAMANLYEMYYAVAMNHKLASEGDPRANEWADRVEYCFRYDAELCYDYNNNIAGGKWNHLMDQTHIGYTSWDEPKGGNIMPEIIRVDVSAYKPGGYEYKEKGGVVVMEAERFAECTQGNKTEWTVIPDLGRTLSGLSLMPYTQPVTGASLTYRMKLNSEMKNIRVRLILDSTLPAGAARLIESVVDFSNVNLKEGIHALIIRPLSPAIVLHKIIIDCGSDEVSRLNLQESPYRKVTH